ncbi:hypothetical protein FHL15_005380 [Xylaria flabelliformis]|uniref:FAD/NAD(P)-binding domain-containing protein n=1 Tax=Xylaria flabelliformis TaxID=2512241 RepID=A0A553I0H4_9PEZI|nr:hypothetical protein FHL15_005380 [Xylaria flabelliformis]
MAICSTINNTKGANGFHDSETCPPNWVPIDAAKFALTPRKLRVVCVGAGISGLTLAHYIKYKRNFADYIDLTLYDKNHEVGGTWVEHTYPGLRCDAPSHVYVFPFEPNHTWSEFYSSGEEIQKYIERTADKYGLREYIKLNSRMLESVWDAVSGKWKLKINRQGRIIEDECDILISAVGWLKDKSYDYSGKKVAVIGNGSTGIQIFTEVAKKAAKTVNFIRHPTWVTSNIAAQFTPNGHNFPYSEQQMQEFTQSPKKFFQYRKQLEAGINYLWPMMLKGGQENKLITEISTQIMSERLGGKEDLVKKFIPQHAFGCRRLTPGDGYLESLHTGSNRAEMSPIKRITEKGIETEAGEEEFDLIACATGYVIDFIPPWKVVGGGGEELNGRWAHELATGYFSMCVPNMPNFFMFHGPNTPVGQGSILRAQGWMADYILKWVEKIATEGIKCIAPRKDITDEYNVYIQEQLKRTVWSGECPGWYKGTDPRSDRVTVLYAGSILHFKACIENIRGEDFEFEYLSRNRFSYLGNGETARERDQVGDLSYYMSLDTEEDMQAQVERRRDICQA